MGKEKNISMPSIPLKYARSHKFSDDMSTAIVWTNQLKPKYPLLLGSAIYFSDLSDHVFTYIQKVLQLKHFPHSKNSRVKYWMILLLIQTLTPYYRMGIFISLVRIEGVAKIFWPE